MSESQLDLITKTLIPLIAASGGLLEKVAGEVVSYATASAELRNVLHVAINRLEMADRAFEERDKEHDRRVADLHDPNK